MIDYSRICYGCFSEKSGDVCAYCGFSPDKYEHSMQALPLGTILNGRYLTGKVLGIGGFGITYLGFDMTLEIKVAIKEYVPSGMAARSNDGYNMSVLSKRDESGYRSGEEKFLDEARILGKLQNVPNIVSVLNYFNENNTAYFVMDYVDGISLKGLVKKQGGKLPYEQAKTILLPVMEAMSQVHAKSLLHRDISPDNIYITTSGQSKLLDFGAARFALNSEKSMSVILKHGFAPEEQYSTHGNQGPWTDVYAMAATFYNCITGVMPPDAIDRLRQDTLVPPRSLGVAMPEYAEAALMRAMALKAEYRFPNMAAFISALNGVGGAAVVAAVSSATVRSGAPAATVYTAPAATAYTAPAAASTAYAPAAPAVSGYPVPEAGQGFFAKLKTNKPLLAATISAAAVLVVLAVVIPILIVGGKGKNSSGGGGGGLTPQTSQEQSLPQSSQEQSSQQQSSPSVQMATYTHATMNFSFQHPTDFVTQESAMGVNLNKGTEAQIAAIFTQVDGKNAAIYNMEDFVERAESENGWLASIIGTPSLEVIDAKEININGRTACVFDYTSPGSGVAYDGQILTMDPTEGFGCYIAFFGVATSSATHDETYATCLKSMQSFSLTGTPSLGITQASYVSDTHGFQIFYNTADLGGTYTEINSGAVFYPVAGNGTVPEVYVETIPKGGANGNTPDELLNLVLSAYMTNAPDVVFTPGAAFDTGEGRYAFRSMDITAVNAAGSTTFIRLSVAGVNNNWYIVTLNDPTGDETMRATAMRFADQATISLKVLSS